jgi:hypothetical protein
MGGAVERIGDDEYKISFGRQRFVGVLVERLTHTQLIKKLPNI